MFRDVSLVAVYVAVLLLLTAASTQAAQYGTAEEARAMLDKAVAAVKADKTKALDVFNKGGGGFKDRDLYVFCANASEEPNWLPTPKGPFFIAMRLYWPKQAALDGTWKQPPMTKKP